MLSTRSRVPLKDIVIPISVIIVILLSTFLEYSRPKIGQSIYEQLIQVNVTILGFALVGFLYYLGKFDDKKKEYIRLWLEYEKIEAKSSDERNRIAEILSDAFYKSKSHKTPILSWISQPLSETKKKELELIDEIKKHTPEAERLYGINDQVLRDIRLFSIYMGLTITLSFLGLFVLSNSTTSTWILFVATVSVMIIAISYFSVEWKNMREFSEVIYKNELYLELKIEEHNEKSKK